MTKKIKVSVDKFKLNRETDLMPIALSSCNTLKTYLNASGIKLTNETLKDAMSGCNAIEASIRESIEKETAMFKNTVLIQSITAGTDAAIDTLKQNAKRLTGLSNIAHLLHLIVIENEVASLVPNWIDDLQERATNYISDPKEIAIYEAQLKVIQAINELAAVKGSKTELVNLVFSMITFKENRAIFEPLNYALVAADQE
ncbi:MAG: hypothetical protein Q8T08_17570 [Ignavibacteria bacterium]|nr:hypothetical protein [Ignavibacteria bacterium]